MFNLKKNVEIIMSTDTGCCGQRTESYFNGKIGIIQFLKECYGFWKNNGKYVNDFSEFHCKIKEI